MREEGHGKRDEGRFAKLSVRDENYDDGERKCVRLGNKLGGS